MKTIEEKAKAYDEIIEKANKMHHENCEACQMCIEELIPELAESEDERIRKALIWHLTRVDNEIPLGAYHSIDGIEIKDMLTWLEKQAEQKPYNWNDWDENEVLRKGYILGANAILNEILRYIGNHSSFESDILKDKLKELKGE